MLKKNYIIGYAENQHSEIQEFVNSTIVVSPNGKSYINV